MKHADIKIHAYSDGARPLEGEERAPRAHRQAARDAGGGGRGARRHLRFGNVDVHFSYYYTRYAKKQIDFEIARDYVDFVAGLPPRAASSSARTRRASPRMRRRGEPDTVQHPHQGAGGEGRRRRRPLRARQRAHRHACSPRAPKGVSYHDTFDEMTVEEKDGPQLPSTSTSPTSTSTWCGTTILLWVERLPWLKERAPPDFAERVTKSLTKYLLQKRAELKGKDFGRTRASSRCRPALSGSRRKRCPTGL